MNTNWNLDILYKGYDDPAFSNDIKNIDNIAKKMTDFSSKLGAEDVITTVKTIIEYSSELYSTVKNLTAFLQLKQATNTSDKDAINYLNAIHIKSSNLTKVMIQIHQYIENIDDLDALIKSDETLNNHAYYLTKVKAKGKYQLTDEVEEIISKMNLTGAHAWAEQFDLLTSSLEVEMNDKTLTLSEVRNLAYDPNSKVRKAAYEAELKGYEKIKDPIAYSLNNIKGQVNMLCDMRGYESALDEALFHADMKKETLDAMLDAMKEYMPKFRQYLKRKGSLLGHKNGLPWYDLFAVISEDDTKYTVEEAKEYLLKHFRTFSPDLTQMVEQAFDEAWIDFYPKKGKVGGAFCYNLTEQEQSRILGNYDGFLTDIVTLAHELGHAYHGQQIQSHLPLNTDYSMPVAETASTFNENIIMNAAIEEASGHAKIALLESQLQDTTQIILDIYSRYLFEDEVFTRRKNEFLFADQLQEIMIKAQKEAYGDGLDENFLHPYMWTCKGHYYSEELSYYNFPYAFGGLFARGLYALYLEDKEAFLPKYRALLFNTTIMSVEDCAASIGIDLTQKEFWLKSLASYSKVIDSFLEATK